MFRRLNQRFWDWFYAPPVYREPVERRLSMPEVLAIVGAAVLILIWLVIA